MSVAYPCVFEGSSLNSLLSNSSSAAFSALLFGELLLLAADDLDAVDRDEAKEEVEPVSTVSRLPPALFELLLLIGLVVHETALSTSPDSPLPLMLSLLVLWPVAALKRGSVAG